MLRVSRKFLPICYKDFLLYFFLKYKSYLINTEFLNKRTLYINRLNFFLKRTIHQGKVTVLFHPTKYHIGYKSSQFTKTRKPFFFRSKKKK